VLNQLVITLDAGCSGNVTLNVTDGDDIGPYIVPVNVYIAGDANGDGKVDILEYC
jgi:hypothetical protein